eukprot:NODE_4585_length_789_cov_115.841892_g4244_i0.p1 GENE.NODE_4585_length_789_cov_115.841892_g4244_i0~~NODE_4585_length_789_cov_115.841892_g4244_i0.p1  ORF type:complete len:202 (+),score=17.29 NODE_4585_length_789_cov_115.841892_g4244_i0:91-696(+)
MWGPTEASFADAGAYPGAYPYPGRPPAPGPGQFTAPYRGGNFTAALYPARYAIPVVDPKKVPKAQRSRTTFYHDEVPMSHQDTQRYHRRGYSHPRLLKPKRPVYSALPALPDPQVGLHEDVYAPPGELYPNVLTDPLAVPGPNGRHFPQADRHYPLHFPAHQYPVQTRKFDPLEQAPSPVPTQFPTKYPTHSLVPSARHWI